MAEASSPECVFCGIASGAIPSQVVYADKDFVAFLDTRPLFPGHVLLCPREHYVTLPELPQSLAAGTMTLLQVITRAVEAAVGAEGSHIAINNRVSQSVPHLHIHVVPRRRKDGLKGFFWPRKPYKDDEEMKAVREAIEREIRTLRDSDPVLG